MPLIVVTSHKQLVILHCLLILAFGNLLCLSVVLILILRDRFADRGGKKSRTGHGVGQGMQVVYLLHVCVVPFLLATGEQLQGLILSPQPKHPHSQRVGVRAGGDHVHLLISITLLNFLHITYQHLK